MKAYLGIDPGKTGAAAILAPARNLVMFHDWKGPLKALEALFGWRDRFMIAGALIEKPFNARTDGRLSVMSLNENFGIWQGLLTALRIDYFTAYPQQWQSKTFRKAKGQTAKEAAWEAAKACFPGRFTRFSKENGRADACLMARLLSSGYVPPEKKPKPKKRRRRPRAGP